MKDIIYSLSSLTVIIFFSCGTGNVKNTNTNQKDSITTIQDTHTISKTDSIPSIKIGNQIWMAGNLNVDTFLNGDTIPEAKTDNEWIKAGHKGKPAWCYYANDDSNGIDYGKLYNWFAVNDKKRIGTRRLAHSYGKRVEYFN